MFISRFRRLFIAPLVMLLVSCSAVGTPLAVQGEDLPGPAAQASQPVEQTPGVSTETAPPATASPTVPSSTPDPLCVMPQAHPDLNRGEFNQYPQAVEEYLNSGATLDELSQALYTAGVANQPRTAAAVDMTGDGQQDVVVSIYDPDSRRVPPSGTLLIYTCEVGSYHLSFQIGEQADAGTPGIRSLQDLNHDGKAELVTSQGTCGASTCFETIQIVAWNGSNFDNVLEGSSADLADPDIQINDPQGTGIYQVVITAGGAGSVGAGLQRKITRTWTYDPASQHWKTSGDMLAPSDYRLHRVQDADAAFKRQDLDTALVLYRQVLSDQPPLLDWMDPASEKANLSAYAGYKVVVIDTVQGKTAGAQSDLAAMEQAHPPGSPQHAFVEMANEFVLSYSSGVDAACAQVKGFAANHAAQILDPLGSKVFGYANRDYQPEDMCP